MITNPDAIRVLCFGDSNTYGTPGDLDGWTDPVYRWPADVRWTGRLQDALGSGFEIIEEGRPGRTVDMADAGIEGSDGRAYFVPCLHTHNPLDVVVIMLGTNDVKWQFQRSAEEITASLGRLVDDIDAYAADRTGRTPTIVLVAPVPVEQRSEEDEFDEASVRKSNEIGRLLKQLALNRDTLFIDAAGTGTVGADGIHLSADTHPRLAALLADTIRGMR